MAEGGAEAAGGLRLKPRPGALCQTWQTKEVHGWLAWPRLAWPRFFADRLGKNSLLSKAEARPALRSRTVSFGMHGLDAWRSSRQKTESKPSPASFVMS